MLADVRPKRLDLQASSVKFGRDDVDVQLRHCDRRDWGIWITAGPQEAIVGAQNAHEHFQDFDDEGGRPWTTTIVDFVAEILRGEVEVETTFRGSTPIAVRHSNLGAHGNRQHLVYTGFLTPARLFFWRTKRTTTERVSYD